MASDNLVVQYFVAAGAAASIIPLGAFGCAMDCLVLVWKIVVLLRL